MRRRKAKFSHYLSSYDKSEVLAWLRAARERKRAETGRCEGRKPYGYREGEQQIFERMRELRTKGLAYGVIAERMNTEGIPTRTSKRWRPQVVWRILQRHACAKRVLEDVQ
jgi:hypothetical protein